MFRLSPTRALRFPKLLFLLDQPLELLPLLRCECRGYFGLDLLDNGEEPRLKFPAQAFNPFVRLQKDLPHLVLVCSGAPAYDRRGRFGARPANPDGAIPTPNVRRQSR